MPTHSTIDAHLAALDTAIHAANREASVRALLGVLEPRDDDAQQSYEEILRRTQNALATEFHRIRGAGESHDVGR